MKRLEPLSDHHTNTEENDTKKRKISSSIEVLPPLTVILPCLLEIVKYMSFQDLYKLMMVSKSCLESCQQETVLCTLFCIKYGRTLYYHYVGRGMFVADVVKKLKSIGDEEDEDKSLTLEEIEENPLILTNYLCRKRKKITTFAKIGTISSPFDVYLRSDESNDIQSIIARIWQPLKYPSIVEQLQEKVKDLYVMNMNDSWILIYVVQVDEKIELWRGKFCNTQTFGMQVKSDYQGVWTLPNSLSEFYCVHDGFSRMIDQTYCDDFSYCSISSSSQLQGFAIGPEKSYLLLKIFSDSCGQGASYCQCLDPNVSLPNDQIFDHYGQLPIASDFQPFIYYLEDFLERTSEE